MNERKKGYAALRWQGHWKFEMNTTKTARQAAPENHKIISVCGWKGGIIKDKHQFVCKARGDDENGVASRELLCTLPNALTRAPLKSESLEKGLTDKTLTSIPDNLLTLRRREATRIELTMTW